MSFALTKNYLISCYGCRIHFLLIERNLLRNIYDSLSNLITDEQNVALSLYFWGFNENKVIFTFGF